MKNNKKLPPKDALEKALLKKALGYDCNEIVEEYGVDEDGNTKLLKKKVTKKFIAPDIQAVKIMFAHFGNAESDLDAMSDEELKCEKMRLINLLKEQGDDYEDC